MIITDLFNTDGHRLVLENVGSIGVTIHAKDDDEIETFKIFNDRYQLGVDQLIRSR